MHNAVAGALLAFAFSPSSLEGQTRLSSDALLAEAPESPVEEARAVADPRELPAALDASTELGEIEIDGILDETDWREARVFSGFTQQEPVEGNPAEHDTEVRVLFGDEAIWIAARIWDTEPQDIVARLARRDAKGSFDQFSAHLDPNLDGLTGYSFRVSAADVQGDTYFYGDDKMDLAWDAVWSSAVKIDDRGWTAEMRIPLSQIRYQASDDVQTWGINFHRLRVANNERSYHSLISKLRKGIVSQMGRMDNVRVTRPSRRLEILPYAVSSLHQGPATAGDPFFDGTAAGGRLGMDVSYRLGAAFTLDATINPDFGQVEADPAVINLSALETFFPEQRPFFVEDARVFDFKLSGARNQLFYSRRVGRAPHGRAPFDTDFAEVPENATILGAAKLAGRTASGLSVGALAAVTGNEFGEGLFEDGTTDNFLVEPRSEFGVLSLGQDLNGGATQIGGIVTAMRRELPGDGSFAWLPSSAFNGGIRYTHQWSDRNWGVNGFFVGSHVRGTETAIERIQRASNHYLQRPDATRHTLDPTRTSLTGQNWRFTFSKRGGEHWTGSLWAAEVSPMFDINEVGFSTRSEVLDAGARWSYKEIRPGSLYRNYNVTFTSYHNWSHEALDDVWSVASWQNARTTGTYSLTAGGQFLNKCTRDCLTTSHGVSFCSINPCNTCRYNAGGTPHPVPGRCFALPLIAYERKRGSSAQRRDPRECRGAVA